MIRPAPAARLAAVRLLTGGYTVFYLARRRQMFAELAETDPALFAPVGPVRVLDAPLDPGTARRLNDAALAMAALFTLGAAHRVTGPLHAALLTWTLSYRNSWSMIFHNDNLTVLHAVALATGRSADAVSIDAAVANRGPRHRVLRDEHPRYGWPLQLMNATTAATYLLAGVAKVCGPLGWRWAHGSTLRRQVAADGLRKEVFGSSAAPLGYVLYRHRHLFTAMAAATLVVELGAPSAVLHPRAGRYWALAAFAMHWGVLAVMNIRFRYQLSGAAFTSFFPAERLLRIRR